MKEITIICTIIATDEFSEGDVKKMLDASPHVREAHMKVKIEKAKEDNDDGIQHPNRRW
jgi:hypothetical protein